MVEVRYSCKFESYPEVRRCQPETCKTKLVTAGKTATLIKYLVKYDSPIYIGFSFYICIMIKRTEFRALRFLQNIENYHSISFVNGWTITDFTDIYPLGTATHSDCGYTWSITVSGGFNLVHGSNSSQYYRDCYLIFNLTTGESEIYFKINPTDKTAVTVAGIFTDSTIAIPEAFDNSDVDFATLLHFTECGSDCIQTISMNVVFPTDTEASDIELTYTGGSDTTSYGTASAMATYFKNYFAALGFKATSSGASLWVIFNPEAGFNPTNGYNLLDSVVFTVQGAEPPYPYELEPTFRYGEICCNDEYCNLLNLPQGSRMSGFGLHEGQWHYESKATLSYAECDCGAELEAVTGEAFAIPLMTDKTVILYDFTFDLLNKPQFQFYLRSNTDVGVENINRITENNEYGTGTVNFGKFSGTSGDAAIGLTSYGWTTAANDGYTGHNQISFNGLGTSCAGAGFDGRLWSIDINLNTPAIQRYTVDIYFYAKNIMPTDHILQVYVNGATLNALTMTAVVFADTIYTTSVTITVASGPQTVTIGLALSDGSGNIKVSTGANDFVTVFANVRRVYLSDVNYLVGSSDAFKSCKTCHSKQFEHLNTGLENGFPGHLVGGFDIAFPVEMQKTDKKLNRQDTVYITSKGYHIELSSMTDMEEQYTISPWLSESQAEFMSLAFGLTPFTLDSVAFAEASPMEMEYDKIDSAVKCRVALLRDGWNKNRSLC